VTFSPGPGRGFPSPASSLGGPGPKICVVIIAFDRREYLAEAVGSVLRQSIPRSDYELLVLKNFGEPGLEEFLRREGIPQDRPESVAQGAWVAGALTRSHAPLFAFLDDDDLFFPDKLGAALGAFELDPQLGYFHHGCAVFGGGTGPGGGPPPPPVRAGAALGPIRLGPSGDRPRAGARAFSRGAAFNLSSIVVRREVLEANLRWLRESILGVPAFLFYAAWVSGRAIAHTPAVHSRYRLHRSNASASGDRQRTVRWAHLRRLAETRVHDADLILTMLRERGLDPVLGAPVETARSRELLMLASTDPSATRVDVLRATVRLARSSVLQGLRASAPYLWIGLFRMVSRRCSWRWLGVDRPGLATGSTSVDRRPDG